MGQLELSYLRVGKGRGIHRGRRKAIAGTPEDVKMDTVQQIISRVPAWQGTREIHFQQIGGLTNTNYRVQVDGECFVLRVSGENARHLGISRQHELTALQAAARVGLAPEVVLFLLPEGHLITRWIEGRHWDVTEYRTPKHIRLLTETVKRIHALPSSGAVFSPFERVTAFVASARRFDVALPHHFDSFLRTIGVVEDDQRGDSSSWQRFCHNDLVAVNYLFNEAEQSIKVLDWEFSGLGDIYYDLATVVYTHDSDGPIPSDLEEVMLASYFGDVSARHHRRLQGMKYMLMLFTGAWALAQYGMQKAGLIPAVDGFDYLEFAEYLFVHDIRDLQQSIIG